MNNYPYIIIPVITVILTQVVKAGIDYKNGNFNWMNLFAGYGGMPSSHASLCSSLCTTAAIYDGFDSTIFGVSCIFTLIILRDAMGFRFEVGKQGKVLNRLIEKLPNDEEFSYPLLEERTGHTGLQVLVGTLFGIVLTLLLSIFI